jgi:hypothetical protein
MERRDVVFCRNSCRIKRQHCLTTIIYGVAAPVKTPLMGPARAN